MTADIRATVLAAMEAVAPGAAQRTIAPDRPLREQIELDSMDWLNLLDELGERLAIDIPAADHARLATLDAIVEYAASAPRRAAQPHALALPRTCHVVDGTPVQVRPMRADDATLEADFVRGLSDDSRYNRFMVTLRELPEHKLDELTHVDQQNHVALVAAVEHDGREQIVGVARYVVDDSRTGCEFAVTVADAWQGSGLAGLLMHMLVKVARARGLTTMEGLVLRTNTHMRDFARRLGFQVRSDPADRDTVRVVRALQDRSHPENPEVP
ncbi:MAG TPA: GNAT family N-acetyltransferase [Albitalea sp.]